MNAPAEPAAQGSGAWFYERCGFVTASRFKDVLDFTKAGKPGAKRTAYLWEVVIERLTGQPADHYSNAAMEWGTEQEQHSRMAYEAATGRMVEETGFIKHPTLPMVGGSPDGLIADNGGWESKSPFNSAVHLATVLDGMPADHMPQVQGLMWITGRAWWDFTSYDPRLPAALQMYVQRIERDDEYIVNMEGEIIKFQAEVAALLAKLTPKESAAPASPPAAQPSPLQSGGEPGAADLVTDMQAIELEELCKQAKVDAAKFLKKAGAESFAQMLAADFAEARDYFLGRIV